MSILAKKKIKPASSFALVCGGDDQANLVDLLGRLPFLNLSCSVSTFYAQDPTFSTVSLTL
jgi:hypothetical protein